MFKKEKKDIKKIKDVKGSFYTDIIHEFRDGILMDIYLDGEKEVKKVISEDK